MILKKPHFNVNNFSKYDYFRNTYLFIKDKNVEIWNLFVSFCKFKGVIIQSRKSIDTEKKVKKVTLKIEAKEYDINLQDDIAEAMGRLIHEDFSSPDEISIKELLSAYIKNSIDRHRLQDELETIYRKIDAIDL